MTVEMTEGEIHSIEPDLRREIMAAGNLLIGAKEIVDKQPDLHTLQANEAMDRLMRLIQTREGLAALQALHS